jgi:diaminopimelate decarboxylase
MMGDQTTRITPADELEKVLTSSDCLSVDPSGTLMVEGCSATDLLERYGSPLYVVSESTLVTNYRRIHRAFSDLWPEPINVLYAIKANNNLAIRAIMNLEGAGGDCFGDGELHATFAGGADPAKVVMNGSNKSPALIRMAVERGVTVNIDAEDEVGFLERAAAELGTTARAKIRLKVRSDEYDAITTDYFGGDRLADYVRRVKWGFSVDAAEQVIRRALDCSGIDFLGYHFHIGRTTTDLRFNRIWARALADIVVELHRRLGFSPSVINVGGGWPRERDPESRSLELNPTPVEEYAAAVCSILLDTLEAAGLPIPQLWLEPGRFIVGNAAVFLATVGPVKRDIGLTWVNVDASTNNVMRIDTSGSAHHVFPATGMHREAIERVTIVGETCIDSIFCADRPMPVLERGDPIVILDAGMYAETGSTQLNGIPRPATVLVNGASSEIIKERETVEDVFAKHRIPARLRIAD